MSIEATSHPALATKKQLKDYLESLGYTPCKHLWNWPKGSLTYHWYNSTDYLSYDGVEATIHPLTEDPHKLGSCDWVLHTRTRASASPADKAFQNQTIEGARAKFGGNFYNDWGARNRNPKPPIEKRDAASRGLYLSYEVVRDHLSSVKFSIPSETMLDLANSSLRDMAKMDPSRVLYNALVPFAVASLEGFLADAFKILIKYDAGAQTYMRTQTRKVDFEDAIEISNQRRTLEDVVASWYSFQNIASIQKAFSEWLSIDFRAIMRGAFTKRSATFNLDDALTKIVALRHAVIHGLALDLDMRKDGIEHLFDDTQSIIDAFLDHIEVSRGVKIRD